MKQNRRTFLKNSSAAAAGISLFGFMEASCNIEVSDDFQLEIYATNWGFPGTTEEFCRKAKEAGYDGVEVWVPNEAAKTEELQRAVEKYQLKLGLLAGNWGDTFEKNLEVFKTSISNSIKLQPEFINCHSGKDYYSAEKNAQFLQHTIDQSKASGIPISHETHRGRILFTAPTANHFIDEMEDLRITLDISHWCCVHESLLADQKEIIDKVLTRTTHVHSRVGFAEAPQIPDPLSEHYKDPVEAHFAWWDEVVRQKSEAGEKLTMTPEFGPPPYMWTDPKDGKPLADNWEVNIAMMELWKKRYLS